MRFVVSFKIINHFPLPSQWLRRISVGGREEALAELCSAFARLCTEEQVADPEQDTGMAFLSPILEMIYKQLGNVMSLIFLLTHYIQSSRNLIRKFENLM